MIGQSHLTRQVCGAATRFLAWRAGHQVQAIDPHELRELAREAQEFAQLVRRLPGRRGFGQGGAPGLSA